MCALLSLVKSRLISTMTERGSLSAKDIGIRPERRKLCKEMVKGRKFGQEEVEFCRR
jgi:hypothetical protein